MSQTPPWSDPRYSNKTNGSQPASSPGNAAHQPPNNATPWAQQLQRPQPVKSRTPLWITIGVLSFLLVVAIVVGGTLGFKALFADDLATDDYAYEEPSDGEPMDEPDAVEQESSWTVEDIIAATCDMGTWDENGGEVFAEASSNSKCMRSTGATTSFIHIGIFSSDFEAENAIAHWSKNFPYYVSEPLSSGERLVLVSDDPEGLQSLSDEFGITVH